MRRRHKRIRDESRFTFPLSFVDVSFLCVGIAFVAADFRTKDVHLPILREAIGETAGNRESGGPKIVLAASGEATFNGKKVEVEQIPSLLADKANAGRVTLDVEENASGQISKSQLQLQLRLSQAGLWDRVQLRIREASSP